MAREILAAPDDAAEISLACIVRAEVVAVVVLEDILDTGTSVVLGSVVDADDLAEVVVAGKVNSLVAH